MLDPAGITTAEEVMSNENEKPNHIQKFDLVYPEGGIAYIHLADISGVTTSKSELPNEALILLASGKELLVEESPHDVYGRIMSALHTDYS